jgi:hypothetical protein
MKLNGLQGEDVEEEDAKGDEGGGETETARDRREIKRRRDGET